MHGIDDRPLKHSLNSGHIIVDPGDDVSGPGIGEELQRHPLQYAVHGVPYIENDPLGNQRVQVAFANSYQAHKKRNPHVAQSVEGQQSEVFLDQSSVYDRSCEERRKQPQYGCGADAQENQRHELPVRLEISQYAKKHVLGDVGLLL